jgi:uncharacterized membrane protein YedE/YeeE
MASLVHAIVGGALIGTASAGLLLVNGRIAGISGILAGAIRPAAARWQWAFVGGLIAAGVLARIAGFAAPLSLGLEPGVILGCAGLLVGFGTRVGSGCTSGHGVCGLANLSPRSMVATLTFMVAAAATVFVIRHLL